MLTTERATQYSEIKTPAPISYTTSLIQRCVVTLPDPQRLCYFFYQVNNKVIIITLTKETKEGTVEFKSHWFLSSLGVAC